MKTPQKFMSLHAHTHFSVNDGLGYPKEHFDFCVKNGLPGHAITEHGNFNSFSYAQLLVEQWHKEGKEFRYLPGIEAYFHPDLEEWRKQKADHVAAPKQKKREVETEIKTSSDSETDDVVDIETSNAHTIENEEESKSTKHYDPLKRRHHLVLLPKNSQGLQELFHLTSRSFIEGFYRFPRIDTKMIRETITKGNVIASSACLAGFPAWSIFRTLEGIKFDDLSPDLLLDPTVKDKCVNAVGNAYEMLIDTFGRENLYLEMQFHKIPAQDIVNLSILEFARRSGLTDQLIVTCDSHYYNPDVWRERELYKKLAFMNYREFSPDALPKSKDELKCELYPKNVQQEWEEFTKSRDRCKLYTDEDSDLVSDAIERTHFVAFEQIGEVKPDRSMKLLKGLVPTDMTSIECLSRLCIEGMKNRGLKGKKEYIARLKEELEIIDIQNMAEYFINLAKIIELSRDVVLLGPCRGSGGGSLVNYLLYITQLDPIVWKLPFSRFMSKYRVGIPDIDTDVSDRDKVLDVMRKEFGRDNVVPISNYNLLKLKSLLKDLAKFYSVPFDEANRATATVETEVRKATIKAGEDKNLFVLKYEDAVGYVCAQYDSSDLESKRVCDGCSDDCKKKPVSPSFMGFMDKYPEIAQSMSVLFKQNRSLGRHAGGVLVCDDLPKKMPLIVSGGECQSPWVEGMNVKHLEKIGNFIKYDLLGLSTLRLFERTIELILKKNGRAQTFANVKQWFDDNMAVEKIDTNDQSVYEYVYHDGRFPAIFQCVDENTLVQTNNGLKKCVDVTIDDKVRSYNTETRLFEEQDVLNVFDQGTKDCVEVMFDNGKTLVCTPDHLLLTINRGWVEVQDLTIEDELA